MVLLWENVCFVEYLHCLVKRFIVLFKHKLCIRCGISSFCLFSLFFVLLFFVIKKEGENSEQYCLLSDTNICYQNDIERLTKIIKR